jgi:hypothetical protein
VNIVICIYGSFTGINQVNHLTKHIIDPNEKCDVFLHTFSQLKEKDFLEFNPLEMIVEPKNNTDVKDVMSLVKVKNLCVSVNDLGGFNYKRIFFVRADTTFLKPVDLTSLVYKNEVIIDEKDFIKKVEKYNEFSYNPVDLKTFTTSLETISDLNLDPADYVERANFKGSLGLSKWIGYKLFIDYQLPMSTQRIT